MASNKADLRRLGDIQINIPIPNPALAEWLVGPQCKRAVQQITEEIYLIYKQSLPASRMEKRVPGSGQQNLRRHAGRRVSIGESDMGPRWQGWIGNTALSYRPRKGQPYPRFIEYGKPTKGIPGGHQLRDAAERVARDRLDRAAATALANSSGYGGLDERGVPIVGPRPAIPKNELTLQEREAIRRRRIAESQARFRKPPGK